MNAALYLLMTQGVLGAFDTLYYHEWLQRLPGRESGRLELRLHAARDFAYTALFAGLAWFTWEGLIVWALAAVLLAEIVITLWDFIEEDAQRPLPAGERVMHSLMAIIYGAFLANLLPQMVAWAGRPTALVPTSYGLVSWLMTLMSVGVFLSGVRDLLASVRQDDALPGGQISPLS
jgi:hypothetical protein